MGHALSDLRSISECTWRWALGAIIWSEARVLLIILLHMLPVSVSPPNSRWQYGVSCFSCSRRHTLMLDPCSLQELLPEALFLQSVPDSAHRRRFFKSTHIRVYCSTACVHKCCSSWLLLCTSESPPPWQGMEGKQGIMKRCAMRSIETLPDLGVGVMPGCCVLLTLPPLLESALVWLVGDGGGHKAETESDWRL